ncbi:P51 [Xanthomonas phage phiL7]|uniref:p51 n=1 Tax=Xanthomonas phage phiL7 TaxID=538979 RepID=C4ML51_9CAUD|nr:P51 [Xanthomonas phage phiL7]ACE75791.1 P51 [Xanthomonas phage phiL7]
MERKFKPGDRVRIKSLGIYYPCAEQGLFVTNTATVRGYSDPAEYLEAHVFVRPDGGLLDWGIPWSFEECELELCAVCPEDAV